ncbi:MAG: hypothetical protein Q8911_01365 [Bacillota bacterium]|nr:hypothetical protein [Bacillota bacterium]
MKVIMWKLFRQKRKQCASCLKTFYKPDEGRIEGPIDGYVLTFSQCPYCGGRWVIV